MGEIIRRLEGRLALKEAEGGAERSPGRIAVQLINEKLTEATDDVLDDMTLEDLMEHVNRAAAGGQGMYFI